LTDLLLASEEGFCSMESIIHQSNKCSLRCFQNSIRQISKLCTCYNYNKLCGSSSPGRDWEFFSSPPRPYHLWGRPSLLSNEYQGLFSGGKVAVGVKLITYLHILPRSRMCGSIPPFPNTPSWCGGQLKKHRGNSTSLCLETL